MNHDPALLLISHTKSPPALGLWIWELCAHSQPRSSPSGDSSSRGCLRQEVGGEEAEGYSQSPDLRHVVEAGDQDAADVVVVEGAAETEENL